MVYVQKQGDFDETSAAVVPFAVLVLVIER